MGITAAFRTPGRLLGRSVGRALDSPTPWAISLEWFVCIPNGEHVEMDERAQIFFAQALDDAGFRRFAPAVDVEGLFSVGDRSNGCYPESPKDVPASLVLRGGPGMAGVSARSVRVAAISKSFADSCAKGPHGNKRHP